MSDVVLVLIALAAWIVVGLVTALWMARRGHRSPGWLFMGAVFGPVLAVTAGERVEHAPQGPPPAGTAEGQGLLRVLVGVDGSPESRQALRTAVHLFGPYAPTLVAAVVADYDSAEAERAGDPAAAVRRRIGTPDRDVTPYLTEYEVLAGPPAEAFGRYARENRMDLVVVGRHGRGLSKRLMGSVPQALLREGAVPVLVTGGPGAPRRR
ncbi:universal stress protein [Streptomyces sp. SS162]|uniref:universal stress protein n=1 Tax=Streptomyces sp. SS162 TaxID=3108484 RepID=UPI002F41961F